MCLNLSADRANIVVLLNTHSISPRVEFLIYSISPRHAFCIQPGPRYQSLSMIHKFTNSRRSREIALRNPFSSWSSLYTVRHTTGPEDANQHVLLHFACFVLHCIHNALFAHVILIGEVKWNHGVPLRHQPPERERERERTDRCPEQQQDTVVFCTWATRGALGKRHCRSIH